MNLCHLYGFFWNHRRLFWWMKFMWSCWDFVPSKRTILFILHNKKFFQGRTHPLILNCLICWWRKVLRQISFTSISNLRWTRNMLARFWKWEKIWLYPMGMTHTSAKGYANFGHWLEKMNRCPKYAYKNIFQTIDLLSTLLDSYAHKLLWDDSNLPALVKMRSTLNEMIQLISSYSSLMAAHEAKTELPNLTAGPPTDYAVRKVMLKSKYVWIILLCLKYFCWV